MLRITELKLPLDHAADALRPAICQRLGIADSDLLDFSLFRRGYDARKKSAIVLIYTVDCALPFRNCWACQPPTSRTSTFSSAALTLARPTCWPSTSSMSR